MYCDLNNNSKSLIMNEYSWVRKIDLSPRSKAVVYMWFFAACSLMSFSVWPSPYYVCEDYISFGYGVKRAARLAVCFLEIVIMFIFHTLFPRTASWF